jgi:precorrin-8X/cobalt-precorrin-8 methylmutase
MAGAVSFRLVVVADWSAASTRGPAKPARDRCWVAWGRAGEPRPAPRYFRTRAEAEGFIFGLLVGEPGAALVGFDFAFGYPADTGLPAGRALCAKLDGLIRDEPDGANNRFEVAGVLNREIQAAFGGGFEGPFWGHPAGRAYAHLSATRPRPFPSRISDGRLVERRLASRRIQSPWKLFTRASVGSQTLVGLPAVHRLLTDPALAPRARLWPFETAWDAAVDGDSIVIAELWPSLVDCRDQPYPIKDACQVAAVRDWALDAPEALARTLARPADLTPDEERTAREVEGWIAGNV